MCTCCFHLAAQLLQDIWLQLLLYFLHRQHRCKPLCRFAALR
jgi:hypothetical protein